VERHYSNWLEERVERLRARHGLAGRWEAPAAQLPLQLPLFS
jgi:hypothetical protein